MFPYVQKVYQLFDFASSLEPLILIRKIITRRICLKHICVLYRKNTNYEFIKRGNVIKLWNVLGKSCELLYIFWAGERFGRYQSFTTYSEIYIFTVNNDVLIKINWFGEMRTK